MTKYLPTIGLEIHAELKTNSKMFCGCRNDPFCKESNTHTCEVCLGLPGSLPVFNKQAIEWTILVGRALNCKIRQPAVWARKHYFYPDLPKGFQISQYDQPLCENGELNNVKIKRIHLEEDTGKLIHPVKENYSLIDYNRAGVPLVELVTEPVIKSGAEARKFAEDYQLLLRHLNVSNADMEKGEMRVEVNISLMPIKDTSEESFGHLGGEGGQLGTKVEIKNLNSFKAVEKAIKYEIKRQKALLEKGETVIQETRGWNEKKRITISQRIKEESADYRYFPEPDLSPLATKNLDFRFKNLELPEEKKKEYQGYGISEKDAEVLMKNKAKAEKLTEIINAIDNREIIKTAASLIIHQAKAGDLPAEKIIELAKLPSHQRKIILACGEIKPEIGIKILNGIITDVIMENPEAIATYKRGKKSALQFLIGEVMAETRGGAEPNIIRQKILEMLS